MSQPRGLRIDVHAPPADATATTTTTTTTTPATATTTTPATALRPSWFKGGKADKDNQNAFRFGSQTSPAPSPTSPAATATATATTPATATAPPPSPPPKAVDDSGAPAKPFLSPKAAHGPRSYHPRPAGFGPSTGNAGSPTASATFPHHGSRSGATAHPHSHVHGRSAAFYAGRDAQSSAGPQSQPQAVLADYPANQRRDVPYYSRRDILRLHRPTTMDRVDEALADILSECSLPPVSHLVERRIPDYPERSRPNILGSSSAFASSARVDFDDFLESRMKGTDVSSKTKAPEKRSQDESKAYESSTYLDPVAIGRQEFKERMAAQMAANQPKTSNQTDTFFDKPGRISSSLPSSTPVTPSLENTEVDSSSQTESALPAGSRLHQFREKIETEADGLAPWPIPARGTTPTPIQKPYSPKLPAEMAEGVHENGPQPGLMPE